MACRSLMPHFHINIYNTLVETWETSLIIAACAGYIEIAKLLIKYHAEVDIQDIDGKTVLHYAIDSGEKEIVKLLLKNGANMHTQTKLGISPFMLARDTNLQIFRLFLERENVLV
ncbi:hypothetical protein NF27_DM00010 [Candidatus Jidaibacter acanthamoeba]|uniref:Protein fem-1 homolog B n=1 Tax=Candidatus Jidaibacter acanthamoebae TaxID=86105 RepID=A0A0C1MSX8_9RICK|nr:hypothetical protein NF27_EJ00010 [Candidatus Jidaibacter acanthamoeba]KIE05699.1 hypothetical protein NF27_DM00010 [Candidatus Jidaibacter acanthamoeba]